MSVSPVMSPMVSVYVPSRAATVDEEHEKIIRMLKMLGLVSTGDKAADKVLLQAAINAQQKQNTGGAKAESIPFQDIMNMLNIESSGKIDKDYTSTINELDDRISAAGDEEEKQYYLELKNRVETQYSDHGENKSAVAQFTGASQLSDLNRYLLLG